MLRGYLPELGDMTGGRWDGIGDPCQYAHLAGEIAQDIADGKWAAGDRVYMRPDGYHAWYFYAERREVVRRALQLLAARGEITVREDGYYVRSRNGNPR
jgi:DNA-binding GntR family transcriptional regulator